MFCTYYAFLPLPDIVSQEGPSRVVKSHRSIPPIPPPISHAPSAPFSSTSIRHLMSLIWSEALNQRFKASESHARINFLANISIHWSTFAKSPPLAVSPSHVMSTQTLHIATFDCDTPVPNVYAERGLYSDIFADLLRIAHTQTPSLPPNLELQFSSYDSVIGIYPTEEELEKIDAIILTGSGKSAHPLSLLKSLLISI